MTSSIKGPSNDGKGAGTDVLVIHFDARLFIKELDLDTRDNIL